MSTVGQRERATQDRVVTLFREELGYRYLGDRKGRAGNRNVEEDLLADWLRGRGTSEALITRALRKLRQAAALGGGTSLYDANRAVYALLRYGVSIAEGIRQNLDNQKKAFIQPFFTTVQLILAGNDTEGLRYGTIETPETYYLTWKEEAPAWTPGDPPADKYLPTATCANGQGALDCALLRLMSKARFLEIIHDFVVFDAGTKKVGRPNQYFGVQAAKKNVRRRKGGILWHTQGSGKSLTMVWLAKWIREHVEGARVLIVTDRTELDDQIESVFKGVGEDVYRTASGADLVRALNGTNPWLLCSLVHKFGRGEADAMDRYVEEVRASLPPGFAAKGEVFVFVDEAHRTQSGKLHRGMKAILPEATFLGFTGTPLLKADKQRTIEIFGPYIHTYKFDEAVRDEVVLDLRYEARDIDQSLPSTGKVDQWFEAKTRGLTDVAKRRLKETWGTMQKVHSSRERLGKIAADILFDMDTKDRLMSGRGNAMLVCSSIYEACRYYEAFSETHLKGKCAIVTSYALSPGDIKGEETGAGLTEKLRQYKIYRTMLADYFGEPEEKAMHRTEAFEQQVKKAFVEAPGQMKLLIVVDKLLTGFDAPPATSSTSTRRCATTASSRPSAASTASTARTRTTDTSSITKTSSSRSKGPSTITPAARSTATTARPDTAPRRPRRFGRRWRTTRACAKRSSSPAAMRRT